MPFCCPSGQNCERLFADNLEVLDALLNINVFVYEQGSGAKPKWVSDFASLIPKAWFPKLGDLPDPTYAPISNEIIPLMEKKLRKVMKLAAENPVITASEENFISPEFADWISNPADPESLKVAEYIRNGISLKEPSTSFPLTDQSEQFPIEHDICTAYDLLKGTTKAGGYFGPIKYTGQKFVSIKLAGSSEVVTNRLNGAPVFMVKKSKRIMEYAGRLVTDLKRNLLNSDYSFEERTIKYPSFREMVSFSRGRT